MVLFCFRATGPLNIPAFFEAIRRLGKRHPALCLMIDDTDGTPRIVTATPDKIPVHVEICPSGEAHPQEWVTRRLQACAAFRVDLRRTPALAVRVLVLSADERIVCFCGHHISLDDLSLTVTLRDFGLFYTAALGPQTTADETPPPAEALVRLDEAHRAPQLRYVPLPWPGRALRLTGDPARAALNIPCRFALDPARVQALRHIARLHGTTVFCVCAAAYKVLLARYCGVDRVAVGVAYSLRGNPAAFEEVGAWVSYAGVETEIDPSAPIGTMGAAFGHELSALRRGKSVCGLAGYSATIVRYLAPRKMPDLPGLTVTDVDPPADSVLVELATSLREVGDRWIILMRGRARLFTPADLNALMDSYVAILDGLIADAQLTADTPLPLRAETVSRYAARAHCAAPDGADIDLSVAFGRSAQRHATAPALSDPACAMDYATLHATAQGLAGWMQHHLGLQPGDRVALYLRRGHLLPLLHLSALLAGLVIVPVDTAYPDDRIAQILQRAACRHVLCSAPEDEDRLTRLVRIAGLDCRITLADPAATDLTPRPAPVPSQPDDPAYVIFTSGSTGIPKGVIVPRRALVRLALGAFQNPVGPGDRVAQLASPGFDALFIEIWSAFLNGGALLCPDRPPTSVDDLSRVLRAGNATHAFLTTSVFNLIVDEDIETLATLRELATGGEVMSAPHAVRVMQRFPGLTLRNVYGPTENGALSTAYRLPAAPAADAITVPIGGPLPGNTALVLDPEGRPVPDGFMGELWLGGPGLALGYDGDPDLTAARFRLFDRASLGLGQGADLRLYRTGDKVRWDATGTAIEYHGRIDAQIKFNGYRIEPAEIEASMLRQPDLRRAAVVTARNGPGGAVSAIWAVYDCTVPPDDPDAFETRLRDLLARDLPRFMLPQRYLYLADGLPLNTSGKIDRKALEALVAQTGATAPARLEGVEKALLAIWSDVLQSDAPRDDADFFAEGGHSVLAMRLLSRLRRELDLTVSVADFLRTPTLRLLDQSLRRQRGTASRKRQTGSEHISLLVSGPEDAPPLFCLPGILGQPVWINPVLPDLSGCGYPVLGLQMPEAPLPESLHDIVRFHAAEIAGWHAGRQITGGPMLAGYSMAGFLTVAVAAELESRGLPPSKVIVIDPGTNLFPPVKGRATPDDEAQSRRLGELRRAHVLQPLRTRIDFIAASRSFPWEKLPPADDWACLAHGSLAIYPVDTHHLSITQKVNAPLLAGLFKGLIDGTARPDRTLHDPWSPSDMEHLQQAAHQMNAGAPSQALDALARLSPERQTYPAVVLQRLRLLEQVLDTSALQAAAQTLLDSPDPPPPAVIFALVETMDRQKCGDLADRLDERLETVANPSPGLMFQRAYRALSRQKHGAVARLLAHPALNRFDPVETTLIRLMAARKASEVQPDGWHDELLAALSAPHTVPSYFSAALRSVLVQGDDATAKALIAQARTMFPNDPAVQDMVTLWKGRVLQWT